MRTADPALNPSAAARRWFPRRPGSPSQPRPRAGEAGGQDGAERAGWGRAGSTVSLPGTGSHGKKGLTGSFGDATRAPREALLSSRRWQPRDSPTHTQPDTCTRTTLSGGTTHTQTGLGREPCSSPSSASPGRHIPAHACSPAAHAAPAATRCDATGTRHGGQRRQPPGLPAVPPVHPGHRPSAPPSTEVREPHTGPASPPACPPAPFGNGCPGTPGGCRGALPTGTGFPTLPRATGTPCLERHTRPTELKEGFWHFRLGCP